MPIAMARIQVFLGFMEKYKPASKNIDVIRRV